MIINNYYKKMMIGGAHMVDEGQDEVRKSDGKLEIGVGVSRDRGVFDK